MRLRRILPALTAAVLPVGLLVAGTAAPANADFVPAPYSASAHGDIAAVSVAGLNGLVSGSLTDVVVGRSLATADSTSTPRTHADSANLEASILGSTVKVNSAGVTAPPSAAYDQTLIDLGVGSVLSTQDLHGSGVANWAGDARCVRDDTPLSESKTRLAGAKVGDLTVPLSSIPLLGLPDLGLNLASIGAATTTSTTRLATDASDPATHDVVSTTTASIATTSLLNGLVQLDVASPVELTARSDGSTGSVTYDNPVVTAKVGTQTRTITAADGTVDLGALVLATDPLTSTPLLSGSVSVTVTPTATQTSGATTAADIGSVASVEVSLSASGALRTLLGSNLASAHLDLLPMSVTATAPAGGVQCQLPPPVVDTPADGAWTTPTPTLKGTGVPGATVEVTVDGSVVGTPTVDQSGGWSLSWPAGRPDLGPGKHRVSATQSLDGLTSERSNTNAFHVAIPPVITAPADGTTTTDTTPTIEGTGQPGASVEVYVDGQDLGSTTVGGDGVWTLPVTTPLPLGSHTVDAVQTDKGGNTLDAPQVGFTVVAPSAQATPPAAGGPQPGNTTTPTSVTPATPTTGTSAHLADTGASAGLLWELLAGLGLVGSGVFLLRRRTA